MTGANRRRSRAGGWRRRPAPVAADSVGPWLANCYRLRVKSGHQCGRSIRGNKERASKVLYIYFGWRIDHWKTESHMRVSPHACAVMPWGDGTRLGLGSCSYDASTIHH
jgi:hypothetical protein